MVVFTCGVSGAGQTVTFRAPRPPVKDGWRTEAAKGWKEKCREEEVGRKSLTNAFERDQAMAS